MKMTWKATVCLLAGIAGVTGVELMAMYHGLNGKFLAGSLAAIAFMAALPIKPEKVMELAKKACDKILMKSAVLVFALGMLAASASGCDKVNFNAKSAADCVTCLVECAQVITSAKTVAACQEDAESDGCREVVSK